MKSLFLILSASLLSINVNAQDSFSGAGSDFKNVNFQITEQVGGLFVSSYFNEYSVKEGVIQYYKLSDILSIEPEHFTQVAIYPNPVKNELTLFTDFRFTTYEVISLTGKIIASGFIQNNTINLSSIASGNYLVRVQGKDSFSIVKIIKQ